MSFTVYLRLGRVSNLPTVWTNVAAGAALGQGEPTPLVLAFLVIPMSLAYVGGMFLNDAFDRDIDAKERKERPIPSGEIGAGRVFKIGFALLGAAVLLVAALVVVDSSARPQAIVTTALLAALIVLYDAWHKQNPASPFIMGLCRGAVYMTAALATGGRVSPALLLGAASLVVYVVGLTFVARYESARRFRGFFALPLLGAPAVLALGGFGADAWTLLFVFVFVGFTVFAVSPLFMRRGEGYVQRSVAQMIAGICLLDGMFVAASGLPILALASGGALFATLLLQRAVRGT